jgi:hypothetical protein
VIPPTLAHVLEATAAVILIEEAAKTATAPLRRELQAVARTVTALWIRLFGSTAAPADPIGLHHIVAGLVQGLSRTNPDMSGHVLTQIQRGVTLGVQQAEHVTGPTDVAPDLPPAIRTAVDNIDRAAAGELTQAVKQAQQLTVDDGYTGVTEVVARAHRAVTTTESTTVWAANAATNHGVLEVARNQGAELLWVAERDACRMCLAMSGAVSHLWEFNPVDATRFGGRPITPWPAGSALVSPPAHPNCRCRVTPWLGSAPGYTGADLPAALKREAQRSILTGWRLPSESESARLAAAHLLLSRGNTLPKSVQDRARRAVAIGHFGAFPRKAA